MGVIQVKFENECGYSEGYGNALKTTVSDDLARKETEECETGRDALDIYHRLR